MDMQNNTGYAGLQVNLFRLAASTFSIAFLYSLNNYRYTIIAVTNGEAEITVEESLVKIKFSNVCILPSYCYIRPAAGSNATFWVLRVTEDYAATAMYNGNNGFLSKPANSIVRNFEAGPSDFKVIKKLLQLLNKHQSYNASANSRVICRLSFNLLISLLKELTASDAPEFKTALKRKEYITVEFLRLVDKEAKEHHDVRYYAGILCMTQGNLTKIVKEVTGKPPKMIIEKILIRMAKELLDNNLRPIYWVAEELNFKSSSAFINFFRNRTGTTPSVYRNRNTRQI